MESKAKGVALCAVYLALTLVFGLLPYVFLIPLLLASVTTNYKTSFVVSLFFGAVSLLYAFTGGSSIVAAAFVAQPCRKTLYRRNRARRIQADGQADKKGRKAEKTSARGRSRRGGQHSKYRLRDIAAVAVYAVLRVRRHHRIPLCGHNADFGRDRTCGKRCAVAADSRRDV